MPRTGSRRITDAGIATNVLSRPTGSPKPTCIIFGPQSGAIKSSRGDKLFGEISGGKPTLPRSVADLKCDYKRTEGPKAVVQPRRAVREDIARSLFYMHVEYGAGP